MSTKQKKVMLAGRQFVVVEGNTIERELYWTTLVIKGSLDGKKPRRDESHAAYTKRLGNLMAQTGVMLDFISTQISPEGEPWSVNGARQTVEFLAEIESAKDRLTVWALLGMVTRELYEGGSAMPWERGAE